MAKQTKLKFKPTPISRLSKYKSPIKMVGDPPWHDWASREKRVYAHMMEIKYWPMPWSPETWDTAWEANRLLDDHIRVKWLDYDVAINDHWHYQHDEAVKENAIWDYHHDNYIAA
jgi:hypothetical protein